MKQDMTEKQGSVDDVVEALYFLGAIAESEGRAKDAMFSYEKAIALAPNDIQCVQALRLIEKSTMH